MYIYIPDVKFNDVTKYTYINRNLIQTTREVALVDLLDFFLPGISFIGDFRDRLPNPNAIHAAQALIKCGVDNGKIIGNYILKGHRDVGNTECPGQTLYDYIQTWPHYNRN